MTFSSEISAGNIITLVSMIVLITGAWARLSAGLIYLGKESERRFEANGNRIDTLDVDVRRLADLGPRFTALEARMNAADIQIAALQTQNTEIAKITTEMNWVKGTVMAIAAKLGVLPTAGH